MLQQIVIVGYHTNSKNKIQKFLETKEPIFSNDSYWLGRGMYFWDNLSNACYWKKEKIRKKEVVEDELAILNARIEVDLENMLDLTDEETLKMLDNLWNIIRIKGKKKIEKEKLGENLDLIFDMFEDSFKCYKVVKCLAKYKNDPMKNYQFFETTRITIGNRIIYSVKDKNCILDSDFYKED